MANDADKRLQAALQKLNNKTTSITNRSSSRPRIPSTSQSISAPPCRPWDRADLIRRLSTFKAITWFAMPKVISPVNCARRGWVNVEMNVITCEACGARLLFSTPSSWTVQQVERAAAVFSLKLDNGHKLLCPWIDNTCDEALARFPPKPPLELVGSYKERFSKLLKLSALPVISPSTIDYLKMKSPRFEFFLSQSPHFSVNINNGIKLIAGSVNKDVESVHEEETSNLYHQAVKVISLCGWELRLLPYVVDNGDQLLLSDSAATSGSSSEILHGQKDSIATYPGGSAVENTEHADRNPFGSQYDPASAVLDCKFCGACVALWAFASVQRPLEIYNVVVNSETQTAANISGNLFREREVGGTDSLSLETQNPSPVTGNSAMKEQYLGLNLTIAGGPPPTKQNFRPRVSFPIVSRHLRVEFNSSRQNDSSGNLGNKQVNDQHLLQDENASPEHSNVDVGYVSQESLKRKRSDGNDIACTRFDADLQSISENRKDMITIPSGTMSSVFGGSTENGIKSVHTDGDPAIEEDLTRQKLENSGNDAIEIQEEIKTDDKEAPTHEKIEALVKSNNEHTTSMCSNDIIVFEDSDSQNKSMAERETTNRNISENPRYELTSNDQPSDSNDFNASFSESPAAVATHFANTESVKDGSDTSNAPNQNFICQSNSNGEKGALSLSIGTASAEHVHGKNPKQLEPAVTSKFDAIRHHRPYCPWIAPEDGECLPGWKLTLSAILQSSPPSNEDVTSNLLDKIDDPIVSVRKLFMSPSSKRLRTAR